MKKSIFILSLIFVVLYSREITAQQIDLSHYTPLKSSGEMPEDISKHFFEIFQTRKDELKKAEPNLKGYSNEYALSSAYYLNQILKSGKLLFGDPLSKYVNTVADSLLRKHPDIRKSVRFYVIRVPIVNAFALDPGVILITTGLLAQIENEAQLAFILSHELVHIINKHSIDLYLTQQKLDKSKDDKGTSMIDSRIFKYHFRSREHESEADKLGVKMFLSGSPYDMNIINGIFDVLQFSHLPFDEKAGFIKSLETDFLHFPEKLILKDINPISMADDADDTLSTHPNIKNRRSYMNDYIKEFDNTGKKLFVQPADLFHKVRDLARFEVIHSQLLEHKYVEAAYNAYIMSEYIPNNPYLEKAFLRSIYGISKYKTHSLGSFLTSDYKKKEGYMHQAYYFFKNISKLEMNVLALRQAWLISKKYPDDVYLNTLCNDLVMDLKLQKIKLDDFQGIKGKLASDSVSTDTMTYPDSKYGRIKENSQKKKTVSKKFSDDKEYLAYALKDIVGDASFSKFFNSVKVVESQDDINISQNNIFKLKRLEIDTILVFNPYFIKLDERKKNTFRIMTSMEKETDITNKARNIADKLKMKTRFITSQNFSQGDVNQYNEFCLISDWLDEFYALNGNFSMPLYQYQYMKEIKNKYNTKYIDLIAFASIVRKKSFAEFMDLFVTSLIIIPIPYTLYMAFNPSYTSVYMNTLADLETGNILYSKRQFFNFNTRRDHVNIRLYDSFNTFRKTKK